MRRLLLLATAWLLLACSEGATEPQGPLPTQHVLVIIADTLRSDALSCYGNDRITTAGIDSLAEDGTRFDNAIASSCWTLPSVASILTGTWPTVHKATGHNPLLTPITPDLQSAPEVLRDAGFRTLAFVNAAFLDARLGLDRGFEIFDHVDVYNKRIRRADETVDVVLTELARAKDLSTFTLIHLFDPHLNYDPPAAFAEGLDDPRFPAPPLSFRKINPLWSKRSGRIPPQETIDFIRRTYEADIAFLDTQVARLIDGLKEQGLYDELTIVFTSDHGEEFWDHGGFEHGHAYFDELIRVPLIVKLPASKTNAEQTAHVDTQVRTLDIFPTLFETTGVPQPATFIGESLSTLCTGSNEPDRQAFSEANLYGGESVAWRTGRFKYVLDRDEQAANRELLFDLENDPRELNNLANDSAHTDIKRELADELEAFLSKIETLGEGFSVPDHHDLSPAKNQDYMQWMQRMNNLGYTNSREGNSREGGSREQR